MSVPVPLLVLSVLSAVVVAAWSLPRPPSGGPARRRLVALAWALALAACWAPVLLLPEDDPGHGNAIAVAFVVSLAGLFVPQLHRLLPRRGPRR